MFFHLKLGLLCLSLVLSQLACRSSDGNGNVASKMYTNNEATEDKKPLSEGYIWIRSGNEPKPKEYFLGEFYTLEELQHAIIERTEVWREQNIKPHNIFFAAEKELLDTEEQFRAAAKNNFNGVQVLFAYKPIRQGNITIISVTEGHKKSKQFQLAHFPNLDELKKAIIEKFPSFAGADPDDLALLVETTTIKTNDDYRLIPTEKLTKYPLSAFVSKKPNQEAQEGEAQNIKKEASHLVKPILIINPVIRQRATFDLSEFETLDDLRGAVMNKLFPSMENSQENRDRLYLTTGTKKIQTNEEYLSMLTEELPSHIHAFLTPE